MISALSMQVPDVSKFIFIPQEVLDFLKLVK
jgi:hypothetical protein